MHCNSKNLIIHVSVLSRSEDLSISPNGYWNASPLPSLKFLKRIDALYVALQDGIQSSSFNSNRFRNLLKCCRVDSPTPIGLIFSDSINAISTSGCSCDNNAAVIQPALPPPTIQIDSTRINCVLIIFVRCLHLIYFTLIPTRISILLYLSIKEIHF